MGYSILYRGYNLTGFNHQKTLLMYYRGLDTCQYSGPSEGVIGDILPVVGKYWRNYENAAATCNGNWGYKWLVEEFIKAKDDEMASGM